MSYKDHLGKEFKTIKEMVEHWGIGAAIYSKRIARGMTQQEALTTPVKEHKINKDKVVDHEGREFKTIKKMVEHWGVSYAAYVNRIKLGHTLECALTEPVRNKRMENSTKCKDHLGNEFESDKKMAKHYNISIDTYNERRGKGLSVKDSLTLPKHTINRLVKDHEGNEFPSTVKMLEHWGITPGLYYYRIKRGYSLEKALTTKEMPTRQVEDHMGNVYKNIDEMLKHYGIDKGNYYSRKRYGWSLKDRITRPKTERNVTKNPDELKAKLTDHLGNVYDSINDMANHYGIESYLYLNRRKYGWTLEESLTIPKGEGRPYLNIEDVKKVRTDHLGNVYSSTSKMAEHYGIDANTYYIRRKRGWSVEKSLTTPTNKRKNKV